VPWASPSRGISEILEKRSVARLCGEAERGPGGRRAPSNPKRSAGSSSWLADRSPPDRPVLENSAGRIGCSDYFSPIHLQPFYRREFGFRKGDFPVTEKVSERTIALPFHNNLATGDVDRVGEELKRALKAVRPGRA
jgi:hypothetical protein